MPYHGAVPQSKRRRCMYALLLAITIRSFASSLFRASTFHPELGFGAFGVPSAGKLGRAVGSKIVHKLNFDTNLITIICASGLEEVVRVHTHTHIQGKSWAGKQIEKKNISTVGYSTLTHPPTSLLCCPGERHFSVGSIGLVTGNWCHQARSLIDIKFE